MGEENKRSRSRKYLKGVFLLGMEMRKEALLERRCGSRVEYFLNRR